MWLSLNEEESSRRSSVVYFICANSCCFPGVLYERPSSPSCCRQTVSRASGRFPSPQEGWPFSLETLFSMGCRRQLGEPQWSLDWFHMKQSHSLSLGWNRFSGIIHSPNRSLSLPVLLQTNLYNWHFTNIFKSFWTLSAKLGKCFLHTCSTFSAALLVLAWCLAKS